MNIRHFHFAFLLLTVAILVAGCDYPEPGDWDFVSHSGTFFLGGLLFAVLTIIAVGNKLPSGNHNIKHLKP